MCRQHFLLQKLLLNARQCSLTRTPGNTISEGIEKLGSRYLPVEDRRTNEERRRTVETFTKVLTVGLVASSKSNSLLEESCGGPKWAWLLFAPLFLLNTPPLPFFWRFFVRKVTKTYGFRNNTCFLSVMLRNLVDYIIIPYFDLRNVTKTHGLRKTPPFDFRHITEFSRIA